MRDVRCKHPRRGKPEQRCYQLLFRASTAGVEIKCPSCRAVQMIPLGSEWMAMAAASTGGI
jgi:phage FluMu protein Com